MRQFFRHKLDKATVHRETTNESANFQSSWPAATEPMLCYVWNSPNTPLRINFGFIERIQEIRDHYQAPVYKLNHIESRPRNANSYELRVAKLYPICRSSNFPAIVTVIFIFVIVIFTTNVKNANLTIQRLEKFRIHQGAVITYTVTFCGNKSFAAFNGYFAEACIFREN